MSFYMIFMSGNRIQPKEPLLNIEEPAPLYLGIILVLSHVGFTLAPSSFQETLRAATMLAARDGEIFLGGRPIGTLPTLLTHTLAHADWVHVLMNAGLIFIFGTLTIRAAKNKYTPVWSRLKRGPLVFIGIFLAGALLGALCQWLVWILTNGTGNALGASTGGAALFAATGYAIGGRERMFGFIFVLIALDAFYIVTGTGNPAWAGHFGGFVAGALLAPRLLNPGGVRLDFFR